MNLVLFVPPAIQLVGRLLHEASDQTQARHRQRQSYHPL